ncbi:H-NS family nucleoid-associated regulatory protein [Stenotrophomonas rhizophila]|uniref:H-NS family nucleoid-associated regulatory protein n=1 Tax=Stenotrophomonas rhizophila TaxID=216778 RepID=UPI001E60CACB|nr:H-NS family nucleoid-associated regulatory protein [Stenotrophomonas rhizophila]MCC7634816.1 H-NS histone family protein [Stenotrophomonas rhizophila]MCC7664511.1 H-NS histone family protein [Stenotrophomonas rhizophila]
MKATLAAAVAGSGMDEQALLRAATQEAYRRVTLLLNASYADFSPEQQRRIRAALGSETPAGAVSPARRGKPGSTAKQDLPPRYWLPYSGETWSGRGRPPKAFLAWEGTVAHTEWKKRHPDQRFPAYPG